MAAALTRNSWQKALLRRSPQSLRRSRINHSSPAPAPASTSESTGYQLHQFKWCSRFPNAFSRTAKEFEASAPSSISRGAAPSSSSSRVGFLGWYSGVAKKRPIVTKSVTAAFIFAAADASAQTLVGGSSDESSDEYDLVRTLRMAGYGFVILGPTLHYWFNFISRVFPSRDVVTTLKKIVLNQTTFGPLMTCVFFSVNAGLQGESGSEIGARLKRDVVPTIVNGLMYWPICDFITFKFVPVHLQPVATNAFSYIWTIYLTYVASLAKVDD